MLTNQKLRWLLLSNVAGWIVMAILGAFVIRSLPHRQTAWLRTERLDIVGEDGRPVLVLANKRAVPGPRMGGKEYPPEIAEPRPYVAGMIFYNDQGDEVGGLIFNGIARDSGYSAVGHLSFDQWQQNQVVALQYLDNGRTRRAGLRVWDRPTDVPLTRELDRAAAFRDASPAVRDSLRRASAEAHARGESGDERLFVGSQDGVAKLELRDTRGRVRVRLAVDERGVAELVFLNEAGQVVDAYPDPR